MKVKKVMQSDVGCVSADAPVSDAARIMWERDCGSVPVLESGRLAGIVTDRDITMAALMTGLPLGLIRVREVMTAEVAFCDGEDDVAVAHDRMREHRVRRLPVVDEESRVVGIVSLNDLVNEAFAGRAKANAKRQRDAAKTLATICEHRSLSAAQAS